MQVRLVSLTCRQYQPQCQPIGSCQHHFHHLQFLTLFCQCTIWLLWWWLPSGWGTLGSRWQRVPMWRLSRRRMRISAMLLREMHHQWSALCWSSLRTRLVYFLANKGLPTTWSRIYPEWVPWARLICQCRWLSLLCLLLSSRCWSLHCAAEIGSIGYLIGVYPPRLWFPAIPYHATNYQLLFQWQHLCLSLLHSLLHILLSKIHIIFMTIVFETALKYVNLRWTATNTDPKQMISSSHIFFWTSPSLLPWDRILSC